MARNVPVRMVFDPCRSGWNPDQFVGASTSPSLEPTSGQLRMSLSAGNAIDRKMMLLVRNNTRPSRKVALYATAGPTARHPTVLQLADSFDSDFLLRCEP